MITSYAILFTLAILSFIELFAKFNALVMRIFGIAIMMIMAVLCLFRSGVAGDYITFKEVFNAVDPQNLSQPMNFFYEPLYSLLQLSVKFLTDDFQIFCLIIGTLVLFLQYKFALYYNPKKMLIANECKNGWLVLHGGILNIKKSGEYLRDREASMGIYFFTSLFILWGLYRANIITTRSSIALCICFYAIKYIESRDLKKFLKTTLIACGFHYSAAIFFPAYFLFHVHCSIVKKIIIMTFASVLLSVGMDLIADTFASIIGGQLGDKVFSYLDTSDDFLAGTGMSGSSAGSMLVIKAIVNMGMLLVVGLYFWKYNKNNIQYEGYLNLYLIGCILYIATLNINYAFARLSIYYNIFQVPMMLYLVSKGKYISNNRMVYWMLLFVYILFRFTINSMGMEIDYPWEQW